MARIITLTEAQTHSGMDREWLYNGIDTLATRAISDVLWDRMTPAFKRTHDFYMALQNPAMAMTMRGIRVNEVRRGARRKEVRLEVNRLIKAISNHPQVVAVWDKLEKETGACHRPSRKDGKHKWPKGEEDTPEKHCVDCGMSRMKVRPFLPSSDDDKLMLFYDKLKMKTMLNKDKRPTTDKEARGKLINKYPKYAELLEMLNLHADLSKQLDFLDFRASRDGRFMTAFNVGVTTTSRWSSNKNAFAEGANAQNVTERHRDILEADPGYELCYADLKQAESNVIAHEAGDEAYIEAHATGDTHTYVTRLIWPEGVGGQEWTWDIFADKKIASGSRPSWDDKPGHDWRFQSKAIQHGSNLGLTPFGMAIQKHITVAAAEEGQERYFRAFPGVRAYQNDIAQAIQESRPVVNALGISFKLFGRPWDKSTVRQGLSLKPQSTVGHVIGVGCWLIHRDLPDIQLLAQVHDAILFQFPKGRYDLVFEALKRMSVPLEITGVDGKARKVTIATEAAVGLNWGHANDKNPDGLREISFDADGNHHIH